MYILHVMSVQCTYYILHLHTSYLLTLVAVVEHMVGFRTIACLSLGLVIFLVFFSPTTHMMLNWVSLNTTTSLVHFDIVSIICRFLLFFVCFLYFNVLSLIHMLEFWLPNPETLIFYFSFVQSCKNFKKGLSLWAHNIICLQNNKNMYL